MPEIRFTDVRRFDSLDSTNRYLLDEARAGAPEGVVAVADHQTAGRGRLGRTWEAPPGANLLLSVLLRPALEPAARHLVTTAVALAAVDAVLALDGDGTSPGDRTSPGDGGNRGDGGSPGDGGSRGIGAGHVALVRIKWPNDLVARDGRKVAGVLAEADLVAGPSGTPPPVVVGIGINVNWPATDEELPPPLRGAATSLCQLTGGPVDREALLGGFLVALGPRVDGLDSAGGRSRLADDLRAACSTLGTTVRVELPDGPLTGRATGITDEGHLIVDVEGTIHTVVAGDVVHVRPGA